MEMEVLHQLVWIKWLLVAVLFVFVAAVGLIGMAMLKMGRMAEQMKSEQHSTDRLKALLDEGKAEEAIALVEARLKKYPDDAQAHWFLAQACYRTGDLHRSLIALRKTQELQPDWEATYTGPLLRVLEQRISDAGGRTDLKVVTPSPSPSRDMTD